MESLIWIGSLLALGGVGALFYCVSIVLKARKTGDDEKIRATLKRVVAINLAALMVSIFGLGLVVMGVILS